MRQQLRWLWFGWLSLLMILSACGTAPSPAIPPGPDATPPPAPRQATAGGLATRTPVAAPQRETSTISRPRPTVAGVTAPPTEAGAPADAPAPSFSADGPWASCMPDGSLSPAEESSVDQAILAEATAATATLLHQGRAALRAGNCAQAATLFIAILRQQPQYGGAYKDLGNTYVKAWRLPEAIAAYTQALRYLPTVAQPITYYSRGVAYQATQQLPEALADYTRAIQQAPQYTFAYINRSSVYFQLGQSAEAAADATQVLAVDPANPLALMNRALAEGRLHEYSQAIADYSALIQVAPNNVTAYYNRAVIHRYNGEKDLARADLHTVQRMTNDVATLQQVERQLQILAAP